MKYVPSIAFDEMSGSAKGVTAAKSRGRKYIRNRGYGGSTRTSSQSSVKAVFKQLSQAWQGLTNEQFLSWNASANSAQGKSVLGTKSKISGANLFMRLNFWVLKCGGTMLTVPPTLSGVDAPSSCTIALTDAAFKFTLDEVPASTTNSSSSSRLPHRRATASPVPTARRSRSVTQGPSQPRTTTSSPITRRYTEPSAQERRKCSSSTST